MALPRWLSKRRRARLVSDESGRKKLPGDGVRRPLLYARSRHGRRRGSATDDSVTRVCGFRAQLIRTEPWQPSREPSGQTSNQGPFTRHPAPRTESRSHWRSTLHWQRCRTYFISRRPAWGLFSLAKRVGQPAATAPSSSGRAAEPRAAAQHQQHGTQHRRQRPLHSDRTQ